MCHDRGYIITKAELEETLEEFKEKFFDLTSERQPARSALNFLVSHYDNSKDILFVFFIDEIKIGTKEIKALRRQMSDNNVSKAIVVLKSTLSAQAKHLVADMAATYYIEYFLDLELLINITDHELVPEHVLMKPEEQAELLNRYKMKENELMRIQVDDPVARYYGLKRGQVVKIIRKSETAGRYTTYRLVI